MASAANSLKQLPSRDGQPPVRRIIGSMLQGKKLRAEERWPSSGFARRSNLDDILDAAAGPGESIGEISIEAGRLTRAQLGRALAEQQSSKERLGQVLVRKGWLSEAELVALLAFQQRLDAACAQRARSLQLQRILIGVALVAAFALSASPRPARAASAGFGSSTMRVTANVLPYLRLQVLKQTPVLSVTADDVARGYIDVPAATDLMAHTNDRNGFSLSFDARSTVFRKAQVTGLVNGLEIGPEGGWVHQPFAGNQMLLRLSYRFFLAPEVAPGSYPWPLQISSTVMY
jgi:hypothetical protein